MKRFISFIAAAALMLSMSACSTQRDTKDESGALISFTDDEGRKIELDEPAQRIISLYSAHTENLYYLDAQSTLIGGYKTCIYPPEAAFLDMYDYSGDPESVISAEPDVVLIRPFISEKAPDFVSALEKAGITVVSLYPDSLDGFDNYIEKLAMLVDRQWKADELLDEFDAELAEISQKTAAVADKKNVFFESTETNIRTVTADSMAGRAIELAGGINIAAGEAPVSEGSTIASFGAEKVLENADNIDVYVSQSGSMNAGGTAASISQRAGFDTVKAVREGNIHIINEKIISSPTFRYVKGVHELARFFYPEIMDDYSAYANDNPATRRSLANFVVQMRHMPIYFPSSSSYYKTEQRGHTFGLFEDVKWNDPDFDYIETVVESGCMKWDDKDGKELFYPDSPVTREELAQTVFVLGNFSQPESRSEIADIDKCENARIVQSLVDNGVFELENGNFNPSRAVTNNEIIAALSHI